MNEGSYSTEYKDHVDLTYNARFEKYIAQGLKWFPWVGKDYERAAVKVLVVAEAHYGINSTEIEYYNNNIDATQHTIWSSRIARQWENKTTRNLDRVLAGSERVDNTQCLWEHLAYYNIVQRTMPTRKDKPSTLDFFLGWELFPHIIKEITPDVCLFCGVNAADTFDVKMHEMQINYKPVCRNREEHICPRSAFIDVADSHLRLIFIHHCGNPYFSWQMYHAYLKKELPHTISFLEELSSSKVK